MRAKVTLTDEFSGRSINIVCEVVNVAHVGEQDKYEYCAEYLSDYQRKRIEDFFGKEQAYHVNATINKLISK